MKTVEQIMSEALEVLRKGGVILYPTDTVWGIGCDATDPAAVARIFEIKKREDSKALVLLAGSLDMVGRYVRVIPEMALELIEVNDSPMTIIYPGAISGKGKGPDGGNVADRHFLAWNAVAEDGTVGIRIPMAEFCRNLAFKLGRPIVSTSANISGEPSPASFKEISDTIRQQMDYVVDPRLGKESTGKASQIIKIGLGGEVKVLRP